MYEKIIRDLQQNDEEKALQHFGIFGMRWGVRRYQNPDGSLTDEGRLRYSKASEEDPDKFVNGSKSVKEMSSDEINAMTRRYNAEKGLKNAMRNMEKAEWEDSTIARTLDELNKINGAYATISKTQDNLDRIISSMKKKKENKKNKRAFKKLQKKVDRAFTKQLDQANTIDDIVKALQEFKQANQTNNDTRFK